MNFLKRHKSTPRVFISLSIGVISYFCLGYFVPPSVRFIASYDLAVLCFLSLAWFMMVRSSLDHLQRLAAEEDVGRWAVLFSLVASACASLFSIAKLLTKNSVSKSQNEVLLVCLSVITILLSWLLIHTLFSLTYAHAYYENSKLSFKKGLNFPGDDVPEYLDFAYFSLVIGMTCQTSDVEITKKYMRKIVLLHSIVTFFFNTTIVALTINLLAGLLN